MGIGCAASLKLVGSMAGLLYATRQRRCCREGARWRRNTGAEALEGYSEIRVESCTFWSVLNSWISFLVLRALVIFPCLNNDFCKV